MEIELEEDGKSWGRVRTGECCGGECLTFNYFTPDGTPLDDQTMTKRYAIELARAILEVAGAEPFGLSDETFERYRLDLLEEIRRSQ